MDDALADVVASRMEILDLFSRYQQLVDDEGGPGGVEALYTPDGEYEQGGSLLRGRDELKAFYDRAPAVRAEAGLTGAKHFFTLPRITVDGDRAEASSDMMLLVPGATGPEIWAVMHYEDELRRLDGTWLLASRRHVTVMDSGRRPPAPHSKGRA